jgi:hypothetical protein
MALPCHLCGTEVVVDSPAGNGVASGFECHDCDQPTCEDCRSIGVARSNEYCKRCRG